MEALREFTLPIRGLKPGLHTYRFSINEQFFAQFENSPVQKGAFDVEVEFNKAPDFMELTFRFQGHMHAPCDRCLVPIDIPYSGEDTVLVKTTDANLEDEADLIYISADAHELNVAQLIYEFVCLHAPPLLLINCTEQPDPPCDPEMLKYITTEQDEPQGESAQDLQSQLARIQAELEQNNNHPSSEKN
jgi:uncharacterized metal-binding protein YceD (DUF177 family)